MKNLYKTTCNRGGEGVIGGDVYDRYMEVSVTVCLEGINPHPQLPLHPLGAN